MLRWSGETQPNEEVPYHHVIAETPFGRFLVTWKGWKEYDSPTIDETPWGEFLGAHSNLEDAKEAAQLAFDQRVTEAVTLRR